jgi:hypothetical protein
MSMVFDAPKKKVKSKVKSKPSTVTRRTVSKPTKSSQKKITVTTVTVAAGPYPTQKIAQDRSAMARKLPKTVVGKIVKTQNGFTFPIQQKFAARSQAEKDQIVKMIQKHRKDAGVNAGSVSIAHQVMTV